MKQMKFSFMSIMAIITHLMATPVPGVGIAMPTLLPPILALQGALVVQSAPIVSTVALVLDTTSVFGAPELEPPPCKFHVFVAVHTYTLLPAGADVKIYISPAPHVAGKLVPLFAGLV